MADTKILTKAKRDKKDEFYTQRVDIEQSDRLTSSNFGIFSFFTGAGFLDLGFENAGFAPMMANEINPNFTTVYRYSREHMGIAPPKFGLDVGDVCAFIDDKEKAAELGHYMAEARGLCKMIGFVGGPPCPDFSIAGKQAGSTGKHGHLSQVYLDLICRNKPDFFVFENVKGLWRTAKHRAFFDAIVKQAKNNGYLVTTRLINALEYGAPQYRERIIFIGIRKDLCPEQADGGDGTLANFPWEKNIQYNMADLQTLDWPKTDAFVENGDLPMPKSVIHPLTIEAWFKHNDVEHHPNANDYFNPRAGLEKMRRFDEGDDSRKCYKRPHRWRFAPTAAYGNNEVHLHPYKARRMSVAETLAIQSLPKEFALPPEISLSAKFKTIGNGVPYLAARGVAKTLKEYLEGLVK